MCLGVSLLLRLPVLFYSKEEHDEASLFVDDLTPFLAMEVMERGGYGQRRRR